MNCKKIRHMRNYMQTLLQFEKAIDLEEIMSLFDATPDEASLSLVNLVRRSPLRTFRLNIMDGDKLMQSYFLQ